MAENHELVERMDYEYDILDYDPVPCGNPSCQLCFPDYYASMSPKQQHDIDELMQSEAIRLFQPDLGGEGGGA